MTVPNLTSILVFWVQSTKELVSGTLHLRTARHRGVNASVSTTLSRNTLAATFLIGSKILESTHQMDSTALQKSFWIKWWSNLSEKD